MNFTAFLSNTGFMSAFEKFHWKEAALKLLAASKIKIACVICRFRVKGGIAETSPFSK